MQKQEKNFFEGHQSTLCIKMPFGIGHPPPTHQLQSTCVWEGSRVPNLQTEFNYLDSFKSYGIFSDFVVPLVPTLSPWSPHHPPSSMCCPCHPHIIPIAPRRSPCGPHGLLVSVVSTCCPHCLHVVCSHVVSISHGCHVSPHCPYVVSTCCPRCPHIIPIIPMSSPHCPHHPHII